MSTSPNEPVTQPLPPFDPSLIDSAPVEPGDLPITDEEDDVYAAYSEVVGELSNQLAESQAEIARLKGKISVDDVRATLLEPYSNKVFWFVLWYCVAVGVILLLAGWKVRTGFALSDAILAIIAGSTAVAVIGLIGMVISGLFGSSKAS